MSLRSGTLSSEPVQGEPAAEPSPAQQPRQPLCPHCTSAMATDQEWCLECGAARTLIRPSPDWRIPVAIVVAVIAIALAGFIVALSRV